MTAFVTGEQRERKLTEVLASVFRDVPQVLETVLIRIVFSPCAGGGPVGWRRRKRRKLVEAQRLNTIRISRCHTSSDNTYAPALHEVVPFRRTTQPWNSRNREDDLYLDVTDSAGRRGRILVEVKIDAEFGWDQVADYSRRADLLRRGTDCQWAATVLIAPRAYLRHPLAAAFNVVVPLGVIRDELTACGRSSEVSFELICKACIHVYVQVPDPDNSQFWADYAAIQAREFPNLTITNYPRDGRGKGPEAIDVYFAGSVDRWPIKHSLRNSAVMIELLSRAYLEQSIHERLAPKFHPEWSLVRPRSGRIQPDGSRGTSIHIVARAPAVTSSKQVKDIMLGLSLVDEFWRWTQANASELLILNDVVPRSR